MKAIFSILLLLMCQASLALEIEETVDTTDSPFIEMSILSGDIEIQAWNKSSVQISGDYSGDSDSFKIETSRDTIRIFAENEGKSWWGGGYESYAKLTLMIPESSKLRLNGTSTDFSTSNVNGRISITSISGSIEVVGGRERVELNSVSGDIDLTGGEGKVYLKTVSGEISAKCDAKIFEGQTVSGDIEASIGTSEDIKLVSVSGDIEAQFALSNDGRVRGSTVSGNIDMLFKKPVNARFEIDTGPGGDIRNKITGDKTEGGRGFGEGLEFTAGDGGGSVDLGTMSGTVTVEED